MWTISNLISIFRIFLSLPFAWALFENEKLIALIIAFLAYLSDLADGFVARKTKTISEYGKIIDPLADKIFVGTGVLMLIIRGFVPIWFAVAVIARDLIILSVGLWAKSKLDYVIPSNYVGKAAVVVIGIACLSAFLELEIAGFMFYLALLAMIISLIVYGIGMKKEFDKREMKLFG